MKKRIFVISALAVGALAAAAGALSPVEKAKAEATPVSNTAADWAVLNPVIEPEDIQDGVQLNNVNGFQVDAYNVNKVPLDGLSFTFSNVLAQDKNNAIYFYFSDTTGSSTPVNCFSFWHDPWQASQFRFHIGTNHAHNGQASSYKETSFTTAGMSGATNLVLNSTNPGTDTLKFDFKRISYSAWEVTIWEVISQTMWNTPNYNISDTGGRHATTYLKNEDVKTYLDEDGKCYMHVAGVGNEGTASITNMTSDPQYVPSGVTKAEMQSEVDAIKDEYIDSFVQYPDVKANLATLKADAQTFLDTEAPASGDISEYKPVTDLTAAWKARYESYKYMDSNTEIGEGVPFEANTGANGANENENGAVQLSLSSNFGNRINYKTEFDMTNFTLEMNLGKVASNVAFPVTFTTEAQYGNYVSESGHLFHIEFLKITQVDYMVIIGNTTQHNISIAGFGTDTSGAFTGKKILNNASGDFKVVVSTNYETGSTNVLINNEVIDYTFTDNSVLYGATMHEGYKGYANIGCHSGSGVCEVMLNEFASPEDYNKEFNNGSASDVVTLNTEFPAGATIFKVETDGVLVPTTGYSIEGKAVILNNKYLNTLAVGTHQVKVTYTYETTSDSSTWNLTVNENEYPDAPYSKTKALAVDKATTVNDAVIEIDINGAQLSEIVVKMDDVALAASSYEWSDFNTKLTIKASALTALSGGEHSLAIQRTGIGKFTITITVTEPPKKGCGGAVIGGVVGITAAVTALGCILLAKKKKEDK